MIHNLGLSVDWFALALGIVQGFVGFTFCISLISPFAALILDVKEASRVSATITKVLAFIFLCIMFYGIGGYWLDSLATEISSRKLLGAYWRGGLFIGFVAWGIVAGTEKRYHRMHKFREDA